LKTFKNFTQIVADFFNYLKESAKTSVKLDQREKNNLTQIDADKKTADWRRFFNFFEESTRISVKIDQQESARKK
jgi:hypothetical protein